MIGQQLGDKYEIVKLIGEGGMGAVYEAKRLDTGRHVAVKLITGAVAEDENLVARFEREAQAAAQVVTPHIVEVLDAGRQRGTGNPFIVMELLSGESVQALLDRIGPLSPDLCARIGAQVCLGLYKAHGAGVVHRDIKPANLFLAQGTGDERIVKLLDFGVAKLKMEHASATGNESLTRTGSVIGSPMFMSPEQARGLKSIDHRADIWSLGIVLYELLCGRTPHADATGLGDLIIAICAEEPPSVRERAPWVPEPLAEVVHGALRLAADERFATAGDMLTALQKCLPGGTAIRASMLVPLTAAERAIGKPGAGDAPVGEGATVAMDATPELSTKTSPTRPGQAASPAAGKAAPPVAVVDAATADPRAPLPAGPSGAAGSPLMAMAPGAAALQPSSPLVQTTASGQARAASAEAPGGTVVSHQGADAPPTGARAGGSSALRAGLGVLVGVAVGLGGMLAYNQLSPPGSSSAGGSATSPRPSRALPGRVDAVTARPAPSAVPTPTASAEPTASAAPPGGPVQAEVEISPVFAGVMVDGKKVVAKQGKIALEGEVGSVHLVVLTVKGKNTTLEVKLTPNGADPPKVEAEVGTAGKGRLPRQDIYDPL